MNSTIKLAAAGAAVLAMLAGCASTVTVHAPARPTSAPAGEAMAAPTPANYDLKFCDRIYGKPYATGTLMHLTGAYDRARRALDSLSYVPLTTKLAADAHTWMLTLDLAQYDVYSGKTAKGLSLLGKAAAYAQATQADCIAAGY
jgi:hypothetical protein